MASPLPCHGHRETYLRLLESIALGRLPHALLFTGPEGIGKRRVAESLAQALLCSSAADQPCGICGPCRLAAEGKHPDRIVVEAEGERIKIDRIRELIHELTFSPLMGAVRVVLIPEAHAFHPAAANALLKTLEEPPAGTYFLLVTHSPGWIPRTIVSRCSLVRFRPLSRSDLQEILQEQGVSADQELLDWGMGSVRRALTLSEVRPTIPPLDRLRDLRSPYSAEQAYQFSQAVAEEDKIESVLQALLSEAHQALTASGLNPPSEESRFDLLCFTDKILEMRRRLKLNINVKIALNRLLLFFRESPASRLQI